MTPCFIFASRNTFLFPFLLSQKKRSLLTSLPLIQFGYRTGRSAGGEFPSWCLSVCLGRSRGDKNNTNSLFSSPQNTRPSGLSCSDEARRSCVRERGAAAARRPRDSPRNARTHAHTRAHTHTGVRTHVHTYIHTPTHMENKFHSFAIESCSLSLLICFSDRICRLYTKSSSYFPGEGET